MLNEPPSKPNRPVHPLERRPSPPEQRPPEASPQRGMLHIRVVSPTMTQALIAINVVISLVMFYVLSDAGRSDWYRIGMNNRLAVLEDGDYHRLFTAMFLHADLAHLTFNMMALYFIGQTVERFFGHARFLIIYLLGGLAGSILSVLLNGPLTNSVGASGAVFAIIGAEIMFVYNHRKLFKETAQHRLRQLIMVSVINLGYGFLSAINPDGVRIDNWGHMGGLAGGLALAYFISPIFLLERRAGTETDFQALDIQPLNERINNVLVYISAMLLLLILGTLWVRGI